MLGSLSKLKRKHPDPHDDMVILEKEGHTYWIRDATGDIASVTSLVEEDLPFFKRFSASQAIRRIKMSRSYKEDETSRYYNMNSKEILEKWAEAARAGSLHHLMIEKYYNSEINEFRLQGHSTDPADYNIPKHLPQFILDHQAEYQPYRTEFLLFNWKLRVAGCADIVFRMRDRLGGDRFALMDWKFARNWTPTKQEKAMLQLSMYRYLLEGWGYNIVEQSIVLMYEGRRRYKKVAVEYDKDRVENILDNRAKDIQKAARKRELVEEHVTKSLRKQRIVLMYEGMKRYKKAAKAMST